MVMIEELEQKMAREASDQNKHGADLAQKDIQIAELNSKLKASEAKVGVSGITLTNKTLRIVPRFILHQLTKSLEPNQPPIVVWCTQLWTNNVANCWCHW